MSLKSFFAIRFTIIAVVIGFAAYFIFYTDYVTAINQLPMLLLVAGISTLGVMGASYRSISSLESTPETLIGAKEEDFDWTDLVNQDEPLHKPNSNSLGNTEIKEVETTTLTAPHKRHNPHSPTPSKRDFDRAIKRRTLEEINRGDIKTKVKMERDKEGKWIITEASSTIETKKQSQKPNKPRMGPVRRRKG